MNKFELMKTSIQNCREVCSRGRHSKKRFSVLNIVAISVIEIVGCGTDIGSKTETHYDSSTENEISDTAEQPLDDAGTVPNDAGAEIQIDPNTLRVELTRNGAAGFCIHPRQLLAATIEPNESGTSLVLTGSVFVGWREDCERSFCPIEEPVGPIELTNEQKIRLTEAITEIPQGDCGPSAMSPYCDPCIVTGVFVNDKGYSADPCGHETCFGYEAAFARLSSLIDRLANPETVEPDPTDCFSPFSNREMAQEQTAVGCACDCPGQNVSLGYDLFGCEYEEDSGLLRWTHTIDLKGTDVCPEESIVTEDELQLCMRNRMRCCVAP